MEQVIFTDDYKEKGAFIMGEVWTKIDFVMSTKRDYEIILNMQ